MSIDYQLPEPAVKPSFVAGTETDYELFIADQMQAAYQAGHADARENLTIAYMAGYSKGRDSMKAECVKVCEDIANKYNCMEEADARIAGQWCRDAIKELK